MSCPHCRSPMTSDDAICPDCGRPRPVSQGPVVARARPSRGLSLVACLLAAPAWLVAIPGLLMTAQVGGSLRHILVAWAVLVAVIAALYFAVRQIDDRDLVLILASLGLWAGGLAVAASMFGFMAFLLLAPIGALAAVAALLGVEALVLDRRAGWSARTPALLACAGLPLLIGSLSLLGAAHAVPRAEQMAGANLRFYAALVVLILAVIPGIWFALRVRREAREGVDLSSDRDLLAGFRRAHSEGQMDDEEFLRVSALLEGGKRPHASGSPPAEQDLGPGSSPRGPLLPPNPTEFT